MGAVTSFNIAVAGAGVAGLACAAFLARSGHGVTVFERTSDGLSNECDLLLQPAGVAVLDTLGLKPRAGANATPIERLYASQYPTRQTVLDVRYGSLRGAGSGLGIERNALLDLLRAAASEAGATLVPATQVVSHRATFADKVRIVTRWGQRAEPFDLIVDALGSESVLNPHGRKEAAYGMLWTCLNWPAEGRLDGRALEMRCHGNGRVVSVLATGQTEARLPRGAVLQWRLPVGAYETWRKAPFEDWKAKASQMWPALAPLLDQVEHREQLRFSRFRTGALEGPGGDRIVHVGDSYHTTNPLLWHGASAALLDGFSLGSCLESAPSVEEGLKAFSNLRQRPVKAMQSADRITQLLFGSRRNSSRFLRDRIASPLLNNYPFSRLAARLFAGTLRTPSSLRRA